jgi:Domain of unknown function (DUF1906)
MALPGSIQAAPSGAVGFDADSVISQNTARQFVDQGYKFCLRYVSHDAGQGKGDLSQAEAGGILAAGLGLMAVQHVRRPGWSPTAELGKTYGNNAANNAAAVGFPPGVNLWCDLEGVNSTAHALDVIGYCNAWCAAVSAAGYLPGLYVGANVILNGQQLYDLAFEHYWRSASKAPDLPARGYQMTQTLVPGKVNGIAIDRDTTQTDSKGGQAIWLIVSTP